MRSNERPSSPPVRTSIPQLIEQRMHAVCCQSLFAAIEFASEVSSTRESTPETALSTIVVRWSPRPPEGDGHRTVVFDTRHGQRGGAMSVAAARDAGRPDSVAAPGAHPVSGQL